MNPDINIEYAKIKKGDLVKWRTWITYGIVLDDSYSRVVQIFWLDDREPEMGLMYTVLWSGVNYTTDLWACDIRLVSKS